MRFQLLTAASMKMTVFWDVALCSLVEIYWCFRWATALMMEAAGTSETSVNFYQTMWCYNQGDSHLQSWKNKTVHVIWQDIPRIIIHTQLQYCKCREREKI
jgi:hypothetical protein